MKRASYREGIEWIALNDDPGSRDSLDPEQVSGYISSLMLATIFGVEPERVARDVVKYRRKEQKLRGNWTGFMTAVGGALTNEMIDRISRQAAEQFGKLPDNMDYLPKQRKPK